MKISLQLSDMSLDELVLLSQGLGREVDKLREQRMHIRGLIEARLLGLRQPAGEGGVSVPGAVIDAGVMN